jgi:hypothetical protein
MMGVPLPSYVVDGEPEPGDRSNALDKNGPLTVWKGAQHYARRGAGQCLECGSLLARDGRPPYCSTCYRKGDFVKWPHREQMRAARDRFVPAIVGGRSRVRAKRAKRHDSS